MKKYGLLVLFVLGFFMFLTPVKADFQTLTCIYQSTNDNTKTYLNFKIRYEPAYVALGDINYYSLDSNNNKKSIFSSDVTSSLNHFANFNKDVGGVSYNLTNILIKKIDKEFPFSDETAVNACPTNVYMLEYKKKTGILNTKIETEYEFYACGKNDSNIDTCDATQKYLLEKAKTANYDSTAGSLHTMQHYTNVTTTKPSTPPTPADPEAGKSDVQDKYNDTREDIEKYCEDENNKNEEECLKSKLELDEIVDDGTEQGHSKEQLEKEYQNYKLNLPIDDIDFDVSNECDSYLGNPEVSGTPAYYLQFIFNIMKYAGILLLFALTVVDVVKAIASSNQDALQ